jgi:hypothetical protein
MINDFLKILGAFFVHDMRYQEGAEPCERTRVDSVENRRRVLFPTSEYIVYIEYIHTEP